MNFSKWLYKYIVFTMTVLPVVGVLLLLGYLITSSEFFSKAGLFFLLGSIGAGLIAGIFIVFFFFLRRKRSKTDFVWNINLTKVSVGLLSCFLLASLCLAVGFNLMTPGSSVSITNNYSQPITGVYLLQGDTRTTLEFGSVLPGQTIKKTFHFQGDSPVVIQIESIQKESVLFDFPGGGFESTAIVDDKAQLSIAKPAL